jgi:hypothetical protein
MDDEMMRGDEAEVERRKYEDRLLQLYKIIGL